MSDVLHPLRDEWERLQSESASDSFFTTWTWCSTWWEHFGADAKLAILTERDDVGRLIGLAPMALRRVRPALMQLELIGSSAPVEHFDFLVRRGDEARVLPKLLARLREVPHDVLSLANILPESTSIPFLRELGFDEREDHVAPVIDLPERRRPAGWLGVVSTPARGSGGGDAAGPAGETPALQIDALLARLQKKKAERFRYYRRRIDRDFPNDWSCTAASTQSEIDEAFDALVRLHQQHWTSRGMPGAFADARMTAFYRDLAHRLAERGWLRMYRLIARGAIVSVDFAFVYRGRFHHFINGTDFATGVDSPGAVLHYCMIEQCIAEGVREYDMMWGEHDYKYDWGARRRADRTFPLDATRKAKVIRAARRWWHAARRR